MLIVLDIDKRAKLFITFTTGFSIAAFLSDNLLVFYLMFEATLVPMYIMICLDGFRNRKYYAANYLLYYTLATSLPFLAILLYIYVTYGTTNIDLLRNLELSNIENLCIGITTLLAFGCKTPIFPFHQWLLEAHVEVLSSGSIVFAAILLKLGRKVRQ